MEFHAASGKWNVEVERDERWAMRTDGKRKNYRFQVQGHAMKIIEQACGLTPPELKFFNITHLTIAGKTVHALRHGMAGQPGWELYGPWEDYGAVHAALVEAAATTAWRWSAGGPIPRIRWNRAGFPHPSR